MQGSTLWISVSPFQHTRKEIRQPNSTISYSFLLTQAYNYLDESDSIISIFSLIYSLTLKYTSSNHKKLSGCETLKDDTPYLRLNFSLVSLILGWSPGGWPLHTLLCAWMWNEVLLDDHNLTHWPQFSISSLIIIILISLFLAIMHSVFSRFPLKSSFANLVTV